VAATDSRCCVRTRVQEIEQETAPATGQEIVRVIVRVIVPEIVVVTVRAHVTGPVAAIALKQRTAPRAVAVTARRVVVVTARRPPTVAVAEATVAAP